MFNVLTEIDPFAVLLAVVASTIVAGLYFAVLITGPYAVALGREGQPPPEASTVSNVGPVVCVVVTTLTSAVLIEALDVTAMGDAIAFGLIVGVGFLTAMAFQIAINPNVPRPLLYGVINAPFFILTSVLTAVIVTAMR